MTTASLDAVVATVRRRFGPQAIQWADQLVASPRPSTVSSGVAALDTVLPGGGIPRGRLTTISGVPGSGRRSLVIRILTMVQASGRTVAWLDMAGTFAPELAAASGLDLHRLVLLRPPESRTAAIITATVLARSALGALVLADLTVPPALATWLHRRLHRTLPSAGCVLLALPSAPRIPPALDLRDRLHLHLEHTRWLYHGAMIVGGWSRATILLPPQPDPLAQVLVPICYPLGIPRP